MKLMVASYFSLLNFVNLLFKDNAMIFLRTAVQKGVGKPKSIYL